jgi:hypothetical protein
LAPADLVGDLQRGIDGFGRCLIAVAARLALAKHGLTLPMSAALVRARPEAAIARDARAGFLRAMRELGLLKVEPPKHKRLNSELRLNSDCGCMNGRHLCR